MATAVATPERFTFEPCGDLASIRDTWIDLAGRSDNVFATYEWLATWWRHFGRDRRLLTTVVRDRSGDVVAILPLYLAAHRPVRTLRLLGHGATDQLGPVCAVADRDRARRAMAAFLDQVTDQPWDLVIADELPVTTDPDPTSHARMLSRHPTHVVGLEGVSGDQWLARRSANLRTQLARGSRTLATTGSVTYRTTDDPAQVDADLAQLIALHERRWAGDGGSRSFTGREAFHHDIARTFLDRGWLRLRFVEVDGTPVAGLYSFRFGGVESHYQSGREPAFDRHSVGLLLHRHAIRACADEGVLEYRFLRGDERYKRRFADRAVEQESVLWARGPLGRAAGAAIARLPKLTRPQLRWVPASLAWGTGGSPRWGQP